MSDFHPEWFGGNEAAARLVAHLCAVAHTWDDLVDRDKPVDEAQINRCFELALVDIPSNPFYQQHINALLPLIYTGVLGYLTANTLEKSGSAHAVEVAHGLRYAVANVAAFAVAVTNPPETTAAILPEAWLTWMPERFTDYAKEHIHAT